MNLERLENERELMTLCLTGGDTEKMLILSDYLDVCTEIGRLKDGGQ
jgi:hypothetical protein